MPRIAAYVLEKRTNNGKEFYDQGVEYATTMRSITVCVLILVIIGAAGYLIKKVVDNG